MEGTAVVGGVGDYARGGTLPINEGFFYNCKYRVYLLRPLRSNSRALFQAEWGADAGADVGVGSRARLLSQPGLFNLG